MTITIVGLGPGDPELLTRRAWRVLSEADEVYLRTARHPGIEDLPIRRIHSFDDWYDAASDFDSLYVRIADEVIRLGARPEGVVYAVPGHPLVGEMTVSLILARADAPETQIDVQIIDGLSFIEPTLNALGIDALNGVQIHDAEDVARMHHPPLNPDLPAILAQVYSPSVASDVKLTLANQYPDDHQVILIHGAGTSDAELEAVPLHDLDHSDAISHLTSLYVPPTPGKSSFEHFQEIIAHLRAPEGCPWDRKQTHESLRQYLLEEAYEVLETIDQDDPAALGKELGDLMLQIVLHTQIATEAGEFQMTDVLNHIIEKMIRRHPHVWGDTQADSADAVKLNWEQIKQREREMLGEGTPNGQTSSVFKSALKDVPGALPALSQAATYHERAARLGFDWPDIAPVWDKLAEEIDELKRAETDDERSEELGDVLSVIVNLARWLKIDPETAMRANNRKFARRFGHIEASAHAAGRKLSEMTLAEMDDLWNAAKRAEHAE
jgi:tetrapyrrole methylase family protein/MazG family protein